MAFFQKKTYAGALSDLAASIHSESGKKIVFADATELVLQAISSAKKRKLCTPIILGNEHDVIATARKLGLSNITSADVHDYLSDDAKEEFSSLVKEYVEIKKTSKTPVNDKEAKELLKKPHYYGAMMVESGSADGMLAGATPETKPLKCSYEIIGLARGVLKTSGLMIMSAGDADVAYFFADCSFTATPTADDLAEFAELAAKTAEACGEEPKVAFLSFSTNGNASHGSIDKIREALEIYQKHNPKIVSDGEIQADCAVDGITYKTKCADSPLKGDANVLIFPDLNSSNISYKLLEKLGGYTATGPIFMGLAKPVNEFARANTVEDAVALISMTVIQTKACRTYALSTTVSKKTKKPAGTGKKYHPMDLIPANVKRIIDSAREKEAKKTKHKEE